MPWSRKQKKLAQAVKRRCPSIKHRPGDHECLCTRCVLWTGF